MSTVLTPGDVVTWVSGLKYVIAEFAPGPNGERLAKLVRKLPHGGTTQFSKAESGLTLVDAPVFAIGERVTVNGWPGTVLGCDDPVHFGPMIVQLDPRPKPLRGGGFVSVDQHPTRVPLHLLVLENRM